LFEIRGVELDTYIYFLLFPSYLVDKPAFEKVEEFRSHIHIGSIWYRGLDRYEPKLKSLRNPSSVSHLEHEVGQENKPADIHDFPDMCLFYSLCAKDIERETMSVVEGFVAQQ
jgi:hypothetical protein